MLTEDDVAALWKMDRAKLNRAMHTIFSRWVRYCSNPMTRESGLTECYTCRKIVAPARCDAGHWISRGKQGTTWDERNVKPQCKACNAFGSPDEPIKGCPSAFRDRLVEDGVDVKELVALSKNTVDRETIIEKFTKCYSELLDAGVCEAYIRQGLSFRQAKRSSRVKRARRK